MDATLRYKFDGVRSGNERPIGAFDSGVGGLSVWRELVALFPNETILYLADQANVPYGSRTQEEIEALTHRAVTWLLERDVKLVVIACNTASAAALNSLRFRWPDIPIVGMEPAVKPASEQTSTGKLGVMATPGTLQAERFSTLVERFAGGVKVYTKICPDLVDLVEAGQLEGPGVNAQLRHLLEPLVAQRIDHLVLGCTHFPFLAPAIQSVVGDDVILVDPAPAVAKQVRRVMTTHSLLASPDASPKHYFFTTANPTNFTESIERLVNVSEPNVVEISLSR